MRRRSPPSPITLLPAHIPTPPRGAPKYHLPVMPRLIPLIDTVGPRLRIHAFTTAPSSLPVGGKSEPARMGCTTVIVPAPERGTTPRSVRGRDYQMSNDGAGREFGKTGGVVRARPPWLASRGLEEAARARADIGVLAPLQEARVRGSK
ncbi:uncharacterized protein MKK02DRAFT_39627 [Dioszegia hungarica]|uniref:Uncharacterized protein n=1 Tax=Dioszegia hungarica TaxID=4972 RepID=A0AA38LY17_9TREE|nr:uncharacterized protein MKK02DRAFT_39627 [Dioszegia hungarica]KAI9639328.1 hypothetical protein MKK02DRAFT_39627 [Dioszegia hungarica]